MTNDDIKRLKSHAQGFLHPMTTNTPEVLHLASGAVLACDALLTALTEERTNNAAPQAAGADTMDRSASDEPRRPEREAMCTHSGEPAGAAPDPGTEKLLMAGYRVVEQNADHNNPIIAWMADARHVLYGSGRVPDPVRDLQAASSPPRETT
jgi:hypothetical protein